MRGAISAYLYLPQGGYTRYNYIRWVGGYFFSSDIAMGFQIGPFYIIAIKSNYPKGLFTVVLLIKCLFTLGSVVKPVLCI